jgi:predicted signal transduction protein with EAL and GGDEF domain
VVAPAETSTSKAMTVADIALYRAKDAGRNRVVYCERSWQDALQPTMSLRTSCDHCNFHDSAACVVSDVDSGLKNGSALMVSDADTGFGPQIL